MFKIIIKETLDFFICGHKEDLYNFTKIHLTDVEWFNLYNLGTLPQDGLTLLSKEMSPYEVDIFETYLNQSELLK